jgi:hypothetical protein
MAEIDEDAYKKWRKVFYEASIAIHDREAKLEHAAELIETNLVLLGATAIEDKLQDVTFINNSFTQHHILLGCARNNCCTIEGRH